MEILLTNDDSHDSPLFGFAIEAFKKLGNIQLVVPRDEQSWTGKSMTRFRALSAQPIRLNGVEGYCLDGTPADCANFGVYHLYENKPDLVVSGINIGSNTGTGFVFSSGTVGACLEANMAGVPAVALSQVLARGLFSAWVKNRSIEPEALAQLRTQTLEILDRTLTYLLAQADFRTHPVTWNVNFPAHPAENYQLVRTVLGHTFYTSCFKRAGDLYQHNIDAPVLDAREDADGTVVRQGHVSITRLDIRAFGQG